MTGLFRPERLRYEIIVNVDNHINQPYLNSLFLYKNLLVFIEKKGLCRWSAYPGLHPGLNYTGPSDLKCIS
jgi:hypothetical protein